MTDLKKPQEEPDAPGQQLLPLISCTLQLDAENQALRAENQALREENEALQETVSTLLRQIRDLKATLDESAANGGSWPV